MLFRSWNNKNDSSRQSPNRRPKRSRPSRRTLAVESLEGRRVLSASPGTVSLDNGVLSICGTSDDDRVILSQDANNIVITANFLSIEEAFASADVTSIIITGEAGNDVILAPTVSVPLSIDGGVGEDQIVGGTGNDALSGGDGDDIISGRDGDDMVLGGAGNDQIDGQNGNDQLRGGTGDDTLYGNHGNDQINGNEDDDLIFGSGDNDILNGDDGNDRIYGGDGDDTINGGSGVDMIIAEDGNDIINSGVGNDVVLAGRGNDDIRGGDGDDLLVGGLGDDVFRGEAGNDVMCGDEGDDELHGGMGDDELRGGSGDDTLLGQGGHDTLLAAGGVDLADGGDGDDLIRGGADRDLVIGGRGADRLNGVGGDDLLISGFSGMDGDVSALRSALSDWNNTDDYATRTAAARASFGNVPTSNDDARIDRIRGESGNDYYLVHSLEDIVFAQDDGEPIGGRTALSASNDTFSIDKNSSLTIPKGFVDLLKNDADPNGESLTVNATPVSGPSNGSVTLGTDGSFNYVPNVGFAGTDLIVYEVSNQSGDTATAGLIVEVNNNPPVATDDSYVVDEDTLLTTIADTNGILKNDVDSNNDAILANTTPVTDVANGSLVLNPDGSFTYSPNLDFTGTDSFVYEITDLAGGRSTATATILVEPIADDPVADDDQYTVDSGSTLNAVAGVNDLLLNDTDADGDAFTVATTPVTGVANGTLTLIEDGTFTYTPDSGFVGQDSFTYTVLDGTGASDSATATIVVNAAP